MDARSLPKSTLGENCPQSFPLRHETTHCSRLLNQEKHHHENIPVMFLTMNMNISTSGDTRRSGGSSSTLMMMMAGRMTMTAAIMSGNSQMPRVV